MLRHAVIANTPESFELSLFLLEKCSQDAVGILQHSGCLHVAALKESEKFAQILLRYGAKADEIDEQGNAPLGIALKHKKYHVFSIFVSAMTANHITAWLNNNVILLCEAIKSNELDAILAVLHQAIQKKYSDKTILDLVRLGADTRVTDPENKTQLQQIIEQKRSDNVIDAILGIPAADAEFYAEKFKRIYHALYAGQAKRRHITCVIFP